MRRWFLLLILISTPLCARSQQSSPALNPAEKRTILLQLYELQSCRGQVVSYEEYAAREKEQDERERANWQRALELERQATQTAQKERDLQAERAAFYEQAFKSVTKKPGLACRSSSRVRCQLARSRSSCSFSRAAYSS